MELRIRKHNLVFLARPQLLLERSVVDFKLCSGTFRNSILLSVLVTPVPSDVVLLLSDGLCRF